MATDNNIPNIDPLMGAFTELNNALQAAFTNLISPIKQNWGNVSSQSNPQLKENLAFSFGENLMNSFDNPDFFKKFGGMNQAQNVGELFDTNNLKRLFDIMNQISQSKIQSWEELFNVINKGKVPPISQQENITKQPDVRIKERIKSESSSDLNERISSRGVRESQKTTNNIPPLYELQNSIRALFGEELGNKIFAPSKRTGMTASYQGLSKEEMRQMFSTWEPMYGKFGGNNQNNIVGNILNSMSGMIGIGPNSGMFENAIRMGLKNGMNMLMMGSMFTDYTNVMGSRGEQFGDFNTLMTKLRGANLKYTEYQAMPNKTPEDVQTMNMWGRLSQIYSETFPNMQREMNKKLFDSMAAYVQEIPMGETIGGKYFPQRQLAQGMWNTKQLITDNPKIGGLIEQGMNIMGRQGRQRGIGYEFQEVLGTNVEAFRSYANNLFNQAKVLQDSPFKNQYKEDISNYISQGLNLNKIADKLEQQISTFTSPKNIAKYFDQMVKMPIRERRQLPEEYQQSQLNLQNDYTRNQKFWTRYLDSARFKKLPTEQQNILGDISNYMVQPYIQQGQVNKEMVRSTQTIGMLSNIAKRNPEQGMKMFNAYNNMQLEEFSRTMGDFNTAWNEYFSLRSNQVKGVINSWSYISGSGGIHEIRNLSSGFAESVGKSFEKNMASIGNMFKIGPAFERVRSRFQQTMTNIEKEVNTLSAQRRIPNISPEESARIGNQISVLESQRNIARRQYYLTTGEPVWNPATGRKEPVIPTMGERMRYSVISPLSSGLGTFGLMNIQNIQMATMFGMSNVLFQALTQLPSQAAYQVSQPITTTLGNVTGLMPLYSTLLSFSQNLPQIVDSIQSSLFSLSSLLGSPIRAQQALTTSLQIARTEPIQFPEAMAVLTAAAVYPETRQYATNDQFQRQLFNAVQMLAMLVPEQGTQGAIFAIREMLGDQYRSLQRRFNISPELISSAVGMTFPQFRTLPANERITKLGEALTNLFGGGDILFQRGSQFSIQLNNLMDTLTQAFVIPLVAKPTATTEMFVNRTMANNFEELKINMPERYTALRRTAEEDLRRRNITPQTPGYNNILNEEMQRLFSSTYNSTMGMLSYTVGSLGNALGSLFQSFDIGNVFSQFINTTTTSVRKSISVYNEELANPNIDAKTASKKFINNLMSGINEGFTTGMTQIRISPLGTVIQATVGNVGNMLRSAMQMTTTAIVKTVISTLVHLPGDIMTQTVSSLSWGSVPKFLKAGLGDKGPSGWGSSLLSSAGTMAGFYSLLTFRNTPQPFVRMLGGFGLAGLAGSENFITNRNTGQMNPMAIPSTLLMGYLAMFGTRGLGSAFKNMGGLGNALVNNKFIRGIRDYFAPERIFFDSKTLKPGSERVLSGGRVLGVAGIGLSVFLSIASTLQRIENLQRLRETERRPYTGMDTLKMWGSGAATAAGYTAPFIADLINRREGRSRGLTRATNIGAYLGGGALTAFGSIVQNRMVGANLTKTIFDAAMSMLPFAVGMFGGGFGGFALTQMLTPLITSAAQHFFPSLRMPEEQQGLSALGNIDYTAYIKNLRNTAELATSQFATQLGPEEALPQNVRADLINAYRQREMVNIPLIQQGTLNIQNSLQRMRGRYNINITTDVQNMVEQTVEQFFNSFNDALKSTDFENTSSVDLLTKQLQQQIDILTDSLFKTLKIKDNPQNREQFQNELGRLLGPTLSAMIGNSMQANTMYNQEYLRAANQIQANPYAEDFYTQLEPPTIEGAKNLQEFAEQRRQYIPKLLENTAMMSQAPAELALGIGGITFDQYRRISTLPGEIFRRDYARPNAQIPMSIISNPQLLQTAWMSFLSSNPSQQEISNAQENISAAWERYLTRMMENYEKTTPEAQALNIDKVAENTSEMLSVERDILQILQKVFGGAEKVLDNNPLIKAGVNAVAPGLGNLPEAGRKIAEDVEKMGGIEGIQKIQQRTEEAITEGKEIVEKVLPTTNVEPGKNIDWDNISTPNISNNEPINLLSRSGFGNNEIVQIGRHDVENYILDLNDYFKEVYPGLNENTNPQLPYYELMQLTPEEIKKQFPNQNLDNETVYGIKFNNPSNLKNYTNPSQALEFIGLLKDMPNTIKPPLPTPFWKRIFNILSPSTAVAAELSPDQQQQLQEYSTAHNFGDIPEFTTRLPDFNTSIPDYLSLYNLGQPFQNTIPNINNLENPFPKPYITMGNINTQMPEFLLPENLDNLINNEPNPYNSKQPVFASLEDFFGYINSLIPDYNNERNLNLPFNTALPDINTLLPEFALPENLDNLINNEQSRYISNAPNSVSKAFKEYMKPSQEYTQEEKLKILSQIPINTFNLGNLAPSLIPPELQKRMDTFNYLFSPIEKDGNILPSRYETGLEQGNIELYNYVNRFLNGGLTQPIGDLQSKIGQGLGFLPTQISGMLPNNMNPLINNVGLPNNNNFAGGLTVNTPNVIINTSA